MISIITIILMMMMMAWANEKSKGCKKVLMIIKR